MPITGENVIGVARSAQGRDRLQAVNPAAGRALPETFAAATVTEVEQAMRLAQAALREYGRFDGKGGHHEL